MDGLHDLHKAREAIEELPEREQRSKRTESFSVAVGCCSKRAHSGWGVWRFDPAWRYDCSILLGRGGERRADNRGRYSHVVLVL
jgi:hypothetical protein